MKKYFILFYTISALPYVGAADLRGGGPQWLRIDQARHPHLQGGFDFGLQAFHEVHQVVHNMRRFFAPLLNSSINQAWERYAHESALFGAPLLELVEILSVTSTQSEVQAIGAVMGQCSAMASFRKYYGPHSIYNVLYRLPERIQRLSNATNLSKAVASLSRKERRKLNKNKRKMLYSLIATTIMKLIVGYSRMIFDRIVGWYNQARINTMPLFGLKFALMIASMVISWQRHTRMRRIMHCLMKKVRTIKEKESNELEQEFDDDKKEEFE